MEVEEKHTLVFVIAAISCGGRGEFITGGRGWVSFSLAFIATGCLDDGSYSDHVPRDAGIDEVGR